LQTFDGCDGEDPRQPVLAGDTSASAARENWRNLG
jgi:hypothetical protein